MTDDIVIVVVGPTRYPVKRVDPITYQATDEAQQFRLEANGRLVIVPREQWIQSPDEQWVSGVTT